ncbi:MAG TPA: hypothetical protein PLM77_02660, partial [Phycisphaerae bacterium]|nr:hypothetical protein [Phycisphaerae bacterium]HXK87182.1 hypothetical protein [Phycisphaerae bacterium]
MRFAPQSSGVIGGRTSCPPEFFGGRASCPPYEPKRETPVLERPFVTCPQYSYGEWLGENGRY